MRLATIDVGTNTALLLVADLADGRMEPVYEAQRFVRLGEGVDAGRRVGEAALGRLRAALLAYRDAADAYGVDAVVVAGTSASRDAENRDALIDFVRRETGWGYEILSGEDEAAWSFAGAVSAFGNLEGTCLVLDVGGGSTEAIVGEAGAADVRYRKSVNVGSVRLTERFFGSQPPSGDVVARAEAFAEEALAAIVLPGGEAPPLIGAAGTATALGLVHAQATSWEALSGHGLALTAEQVRGWRDRLLAMTYDEVLALNPEVLDGRADVFPAGVLVVDAFMRRFGCGAFRVSPRGLRHGLALRHLHGGTADGA